MAKKEKDLADKIMAAINKSFSGAATRLGDGARSDVRGVIPTGIDVLDKYVLGAGGFVEGRITELFSEEGAGKTSLALAAMAGCQRAGGLVIMAETEMALDSQRAKVFGVNIDDVILLQPDHIPMAGQQIEAALHGVPKGVGPILTVWDSVAATMSREEAENGLPDKDSFDKRGKDFSVMMRVLGPLLVKARTHLLAINQVRANVGVMFGDKWTTPCGKALKFHSSVRLQIFGGKAQKDASGQHEGKDVTVIAVKNKFTRPFRKCRLRLNYDTGWDNDWSTLNHAKELGVVDARSRDVVAARKALDAAQWYKVKHDDAMEAAHSIGGVDALEGPDGVDLDSEGL